MIKLIKEEIRKKAEEYSRDMFDFLRRMIAEKSFSGHEESCINIIKAEMEKLGYDNITIDPMGNLIGTIGNGEHIIAYDGHADIVGASDMEGWKFDPFEGFEDYENIGGRGSSDMKGGLAAMVYAGKIIKELGLDRNITLKVTATLQEEDCEGRNWKYIIEEDGIVPELVILGEPTHDAINNGQKGRMEIGIKVKGISSHGSNPDAGVNAIYKMAPIVQAIERLNGELKDDGIMGKGMITISQIFSTSASRCAVADSCTIAVDRRTNSLEDRDSVLNQLRELPEVKSAGGEVFLFTDENPSYTGLKIPFELYYPSWIVEKDSNAVKTVAKCYREFYDKEPEIRPLTASTNGIATMGMHGIPTVIYGPGYLEKAHGYNEITSKDMLIRALEIYTALPQEYIKQIAE